MGAFVTHPSGGRARAPATCGATLEGWPSVGARSVAVGSRPSPRPRLTSGSAERSVVDSGGGSSPCDGDGKLWMSIARTSAFASGSIASTRFVTSRLRRRSPWNCSRKLTKSWTAWRGRHGPASGAKWSGSSDESRPSSALEWTGQDSVTRQLRRRRLGEMALRVPLAWTVSRTGIAREKSAAQMSRRAPPCPR